ncbi:10904_t:CDS:2, partial [Dentiscutata heterogama]
TRKKVKVSSVSDEKIITDTSDNSSSSVLEYQESLINWCIKLMSQNKQGKLDKKLFNAIIYSNFSFRVIKNPYFLDFLNELAPNYDPLSDEMLRTKVLNSSFLTYLAKKLKLITFLANITITLDG